MALAEMLATLSGSGGYAPGSLQIVEGPDGSYSAVNPKTGKLEPVYNDNETSRMYFASDGNMPASAAPAGKPVYSSGNDSSPFEKILSNPLAVFGATTGLGGMTGANAVTGNDIGKGVATDLAGLGAGAGAASLMAPGAMTAANAATLGSMTEGAGTAAAGGTAGAGGAAGAGGLADAGMDLGAFGAGNPYVSGVDPASLAAATGGSTVSAAAGGTAGGVGGAAAGAGAGVGGVSLAKLLSGDVSASDLASTVTLGDLGKILATGASIYGSNEQANKLDALAHEYMGLGAPSRARYEASFDPSFDINKITGLQGAMDTSYQGLLRGLSTQGNPFDNPGGLTEAMKYITGNLAMPALQNYRNQNASSGGYGAFSTAAPGAATGAITAGGNVYSDLGRGIANLTNPPTSLEQALKQLKGLV